MTGVAQATPVFCLAGDSLDQSRQHPLPHVFAAPGTSTILMLYGPKKRLNPRILNVYLHQAYGEGLS